jgi:flagellar biosynthesis GTPase FlhF
MQDIQELLRPYLTDFTHLVFTDPCGALPFAVVLLYFGAFVTKVRPRCRRWAGRLAFTATVLFLGSALLLGVPEGHYFDVLVRGLFGGTVVFGALLLLFAFLAPLGDALSAALRRSREACEERSRLAEHRRREARARAYERELERDRTQAEAERQAHEAAAKARAEAEARAQAEEEAARKAAEPPPPTTEERVAKIRATYAERLAVIDSLPVKEERKKNARQHAERVMLEQVRRVLEEGGT